MLNQKANNGFNPMRWDCEKQGCFNKKCRPKIEIFSECFPGRINFGDVDGIVEINGNALFLEWKCDWKCSLPKISVGQKIMYEKLSKTGIISIIIIFGNAETMESRKYCWFTNGKQSDWIEADIDDIKNQIRQWSKKFEK